MYFIFNVWDIWVLLDKVHGKSRLITDQEIDILRGLYPLLLADQPNSLTALQISYLPLNKLQNQKNRDSPAATPATVAEQVKYVSCKVANNWIIYELNEESSRSMTSSEITFVRSFFAGVIDQASSLVEAIQVCTISLSKLQQLIPLSAPPVGQAAKLGGLQVKK
ncbi:MAG TPA: hypothetical protein VHE34_21215 [Puia sp.]|uniref:hypothetical protein n=1 Tax=Puia sp. TaxID=2045100 RepID=UPI002BCF9D27|nr:hypothetical protein [Puia sp.]HVU97764.1 hypothetical protein [Puia sp.]